MEIMQDKLWLECDAEYNLGVLEDFCESLGIEIHTSNAVNFKKIKVAGVHKIRVIEREYYNGGKDYYKGENLKQGDRNKWLDQAMVTGEDVSVAKHKVDYMKFEVLIDSNEEDGGYEVQMVGDEENVVDNAWNKEIEEVEDNGASQEK